MPITRLPLPALAILAAAGFAQQAPDTAFAPPIAKPAFAPGAGPVVLIDEGHFNFHTATGRYLAFATLLRRDGCVVKPSAAKFSAAALGAGRILVVSNALNEKNQSDWSPPHLPAFTGEEIAAVKQWVAAGGSLLLIADHAPFAGAAEDLGRAFGLRFRDGYAVFPKSDGGDLFRRADGTLRDHAVTRGIDRVATFTGSSFEADGPATPLLVFPPGCVSKKGRDGEATPIAGHLQGAVLEIGKGRVAVFGEAAMFSAQLAGAGKRPMGMNAPHASENPRFVLRVMHWLMGLP